MINSEDDVRAWVREASGGKARWVEPALGSTPGLPDCWVPLEVSHDDFWETACVQMELKCGRMSDGRVKYSLRPEQVREIRAMVDDGLKVGLLIGVKGTTTLIFCRPTPAMLFGGWAFYDEHVEGDWLQVEAGSANGFNYGVNFIFHGGN